MPIIADLPDVKKERLRKSELTDAMNRLLAANKIHIGKTSGPPSKAKKCLRPGPQPSGGAAAQSGYEQF